MVLHRLKCQRPVCTCMRVTYPHRPGSLPLCEVNPMSDALKASLEGATDEEVLDIADEIAFSKPGRRAVVCPF